jgi:hypothetical protein
MASAIRVLHARPLLSPAQIELAKTAYPQLLGGSDLAADVERVKLSQLPLNLEELSKLWSVFFQTTYRLSIAYRASAVLLEADDPGADALPVLRRTLSVETLHEPVVEQAVNASDDALVPRINRTAAGVYDISTLNATWRAVDGVTLHSADVRVGLEQSVGRRQRVALLLNELTAGDAHAYTFVARPRSDDGATITITAVDVIPGTYLLRGQVDGVDSPLDVVAGSYAGPTVTL